MQKTAELTIMVDIYFEKSFSSLFCGSCVLFLIKDKQTSKINILKQFTCMVAFYFALAIYNFSACSFCWLIFLFLCTVRGRLPAKKLAQ
jgi:hypothetical protein